MGGVRRYCVHCQVACSYAATEFCPRRYTDHPAPYPDCFATASNIEKEKIEKNHRRLIQTVSSLG